MPDLIEIEATRIVASPAALDSMAFPHGSPLLRIAPDELLVLGHHVGAECADEWAIIEPDTGWVGAWLSIEDAADRLSHAAAWQLPERDGFVQGMAAGLPIKAVRVGAEVLLIAPHCFRTDFEERLL